MIESGGSLFLQSEGRFKGPGHAGVLSYGGDKNAFTFHFYDAEHENAPSLDNNWASMGIRELVFENNWPLLGAELSANEILVELD